MNSSYFSARFTLYAKIVDDLLNSPQPEHSNDIKCFAWTVFFLDNPITLQNRVA